MASPSSLYPQNVDLTNCDKEPIHKLNRIQLHGAIVSCDLNSLQIVQCSSNISEFLNKTIDEILNLSLESIIGNENFESLKKAIDQQKFAPLDLVVGNKHLLVIPHVHESHCILELEQREEGVDAFTYQQQLTDVITGLSNASDEKQMCDKAAELVKDFFGYDRVMIYQFDENWNGEVISEAREENLESWLGLHYPATDIPQQARKLFLQQGVRLISEITTESVHMVPEISPVTNDIVDLSKSELRAPSLIHIEYLQNMKVGGTLTAAIVYNHTLWGLIACHHYSPKFISYHQRLSCKFLTQVFSTQLGLRAFNTSLQKVNSSSVIRNLLIKQMSENWNITEGLTAFDTTMLNLTEASGAAVFIDGKLTSIGKTPDSEEILKLNNWLTEHKKEDDIYFTNSISSIYDQGYAFKEVASGVLQVAVSKGNNKLFWFKPEIKETVSWGGNPNKPAQISSDARLSPRKSFDKWSEEVSGKSAPWLDYEVAAAKALKESISEIIIQKYDEVMELNQKLEKAYNELESFSYSVSHDLRAPLRGIDGFAQIIKEDYFESLDDFGRNALETIIKSTEKMNLLIDDILHFSGLHQKEMRVGNVDMNSLVNQVIDLNQTAILFPNTKIEIDELPHATGDQSMIIQLLSNLINNALKYSQESPNAKIQIGSYVENGKNVYYISDNGIGIDMQYKDAIFGVFNRLVDDSQYSGSGIGLAIVKRVIEKHFGNVWVESKLGESTTFKFYFNLPE
ncbi:Bacteriophytochrome (light-regulated signal transduction histidine kinase) [Pustulibacterium marinum]|uniref:histidine kinase n=1 Tax=Pustulibacterium marinum TaxID=1224947 RepID=A0A1I7HV27_9FLAO|nr:ATP-binding protein [Pustulibacterium marinum]SFU64553.1 Bacteriophytochrome (light-regulated signal transduction histidine kinase) [Pustulibacterium marinum]